jgi:hypothetical protein
MVIRSDLDYAAEYAQSSAYAQWTSKAVEFLWSELRILQFAQQKYCENCFMIGFGVGYLAMKKPMLFNEFNIFNLIYF